MNATEFQSKDRIKACMRKGGRRDATTLFEPNYMRLEIIVAETSSWAFAKPMIEPRQQANCSDEVINGVGARKAVLR